MNSGIIIILGGAGFCPSTVALVKDSNDLISSLYLLRYCSDDEV